MKLYDECIRGALSLLDSAQGVRLDLSGCAWRDTGVGSLVLRSEAAYELGGGTLPGISGFAVTSSEDLVPKDSVWLYGPDIPAIKHDAPYARLTFVRVAENDMGEGDTAYNEICRMEHTRYKVNPEGFMMRISPSRSHESVRVSHAAIAAGLDFARSGRLLLDGYRAHPNVLAAKMIFITLPDFPYDALNTQVRLMEKITGSLDHIFKNLMMDCSICNLKPVCDEVEGIKELHFSQTKKK